VQLPAPEFEMWYVSKEGYEQRLKSEDMANNWVDAYDKLQVQKDFVAGTAARDRKVARTRHAFGGVFLALAVVLMALGTWLWNDVRIVRRETQGLTGEAFEIPTAQVDAAAGRPDPKSRDRRS
jgi:hypothetical protein